MTNTSDVLSSTSKEVLQTYFMWKIIQSYASKIEADELKPYSQFVNELQGKDPDSTPERWRTCVNHVDDGLGWILSRFFVERAFSEKAKNFGDQVVSDIKEMFIGKLEKTTWMDKSVIELAIEKVHKIVQKIGYPTKVSAARNILAADLANFTFRVLISWIPQACTPSMNLWLLNRQHSSRILSA